MESLDDKISTEIKWYNEQLASLKDVLVAWVKEGGHEIDVSEENITNTEGPSGQYKTFKYIFIIDKNIKLCLLPYGIWIVAAKGRVDITGPSGSEKLVYLCKGGPVLNVEIKSGNYSEKTMHREFDNIDEDGWYWYDDSIIRKMTKLSKETFEYLIGRLQ